MTYEANEKDRKKVESYAAVGIPQRDIARVLDIDVKTLNKYYRDEIETAAIKADAAVGGALYNKAVNEKDTASLIWWSKARLRWSEKKEIEHSGHLQAIPPGGTLEDATRAYEDNLRRQRDGD